MTWRDRLQPASFRGVEFYVDGDTSNGGRRVEPHEFPKRDVPYSEDLGRAMRRFQLSGYLIGDDYLEQRDRLLEALETEGPGTLVHPFYGQHEVVADGTSTSFSHNDREGRMVRLSLAFLEAGQVRNPGSTPNTASRLTTASSSLSTASRSAFGDAYSVTGQPDFVGSLSSAFLAELGVEIEPDAPAATVFDAIESVAASRSLPATVGALAVVPPLPTITTTPARSRVRANAIASVQAVREASVARLGQIVAASDWPIYDDAIAALDDVGAEIDAAIAEAPDELVAPLMELRARAVEHVRAEVRGSTRLRTEIPPAAIPSNVLAWRLYGDADRDAEIVDRNRLADTADAAGALQVLEA